MASFHVYAGAGEAMAPPRIRRIEIGDLYDCLRAGWIDFLAQPTHHIFIVLIYPVIGIILMTWTSGANTLPLMFPLLSGFALVGPFAAIGLYEVSRRREQGLDSSWSSVLALRHSPALPAIAAVGLFLMILFVTWLLVAQALYVWLMGEAVPTSIGAFLAEIVGTREGWMLIVVGNLIGLVFALVVLATSAIAFPLLVDRDAGAYTAIATSVRAALANPAPVLVWGLIVAILLAIGMLPLFAGLVVVLPVLGHATWHLYRKLVEWE